MTWQLTGTNYDTIHTKVIWYRQFCGGGLRGDIGTRGCDNIRRTPGGNKRCQTEEDFQLMPASGVWGTTDGMMRVSDYHTSG